MFDRQATDVVGHGKNPCQLQIYHNQICRREGCTQNQIWLSFQKKKKMGNSATDRNFRSEAVTPHRKQRQVRMSNLMQSEHFYGSMTKTQRNFRPISPIATI